MRFDRFESPEHINDGAGWRPDDARKWLDEHDLFNDKVETGELYLRYKQTATGRFLDVVYADRGVALIQCEA